jgi:hypothetical protein
MYQGVVDARQNLRLAATHELDTEIDDTLVVGEWSLAEMRCPVSSKRFDHCGPVVDPHVGRWASSDSRRREPQPEGGQRCCMSVWMFIVDGRRCR